MISFTRTLEEPILTIAPWAAVRALLEAASTAIWLLDTQIDAKTRVERSLSLRFKALGEQKALGNAEGNQGIVDTVNQRIDHLLKEATDLDFVARNDRKGNPEGITLQFLGFTDLIKHTLNDAGSYRILSGMAHGHDFAVSQLGYVVDPTRSIDSPLAVGNEIAFKKHMSIDSIVMLSSKAAETMCVMMRAITQLFGWDATQLDAIVTRYRQAFVRILDSLKVPPSDGQG